MKNKIRYRIAKFLVLNSWVIIYPLVYVMWIRHVEKTWVNVNFFILS
jgi:hypothetical protein